MSVSNAEVGALFHDLALLTRLEDGNPQSFRARAYDAAARTIEALPAPAVEMSKNELVAQKGIGASTAEKIGEFRDTGSIAKLEELRQRYPPEFLEIVRIPGIGPKTGALLREELGVETVEDLRAAVERQAVRELPGLGAKTEEKLAVALERLGMTGKERRTPIIDGMLLATRLVVELESRDFVQRAIACGSLRRMRETIADLDIVVSSQEPQRVMDDFIELPSVKEVIAHGETKTSVLTQQGLQVDVRVVEPEQLGAALVYFTGSRDHNIRLRQIAQQNDWLLNEYGLLEAEGDRVIASETEEDIYSALRLPWIPPPMREDSGEIEAAIAGTLVEVPYVEDIRGDLHVHSSLSRDADDTLEEMVAAASERGLSYMAITDHGEDLAINGVSREEMIEERERIHRLQEDYPDLVLLHGCELNIGPDGSLDYDQEFLLGFDYCVASVHSQFDLDVTQQTVRILTAMQNPAVNVIGHLQGRRIGKRPGIELDIDAVFEGAELTGTAIEINSHLDRLDASPEVLRQAADRDINFVIDTDSHRIRELAHIRWGVLIAQRGWVAKEKVANTWETERFLRWVAEKRGS
ncbi:MAG: DNA polymerase/3'-5' exonuclease PolX [Acidimicrobiia bacterium]